MSDVSAISDASAARTAGEASLRALLVQRREDRRQGDTAVALIAAAAEVAKQAATSSHEGALDITA